MSKPTKILIGALVTTAAAWFLHGPIGLGKNCSATRGGTDVTAASGLGAAAAGAAASAAAATGAGASDAAGDAANAGNALQAEAVAACQAEVDRAIGAGTITHVSGGAAIAPEAAPLLDQVAAALNHCAGANLEIAGHTDAQGDGGANQVLSQRRADTVLEELVRRGVPRERLTARGYGETQLLDPTGPENNPRNRRIEFTVSAAAAHATTI